MKKIELTRGLHAIVDDADFDMLSAYSWHATAKGYAATNVKVGHLKYKYTFMHHMLITLEEGQVTDHINGNRADNRRENLRACNTQQNSWNRPSRSDNTTGMKGVYPRTDGYGFNAVITLGKKRLFLGIFKTVDEASSAYQAASKNLHGEFSRKI